MASNPDAHAHTPLGVGNIISESFSILFKNIVTVMLLGFVPILIQLVVSGAFLGWDTALGGQEPSFSSSGAIILYVVVLLAQMGIYGLIIALLVQMAYHAKLGRPITIGRYISPALRAAIPVVILTFIVGILAGLGFLALVIPGLWVYAVYSVTVPAVVIENAGFGAMGRSRTLTKEYRWPVLGALVLVGLCTMLLSFGVVFVYGVITAVVGVGVFGIGVAVLVNAAFSAVIYGLSGIAVALIYARLREIKEGVSVDKLAAVFD